MREDGRSLLEMVVVAGILMVLAAVAMPSYKVYAARSRLMGAARVFEGEFIRARSVAMMRNVYTAMRFEPRSEGVYYSLYVDGNRNGVLSHDIDRGVDRRLSGPTPLDAGVAGVRVAILPGVSAPPPDSGPLDASDAIRFGRSDMLSFSPLGTATPGTIYLAGDEMQAAIRVTGGSARVRILFWQDGRWLSK
jgi:hypothetical protein